MIINAIQDNTARVLCPDDGYYLQRDAPTKNDDTRVNRGERERNRDNGLELMT